MKYLLFEKVNKIDQPLARLLGKQEERHYIILGIMEGI